jgi:prepilin-type N-terminal cleavage/methylation domain-containing protein/prepilin-type processing-associated H-X9-DG protein
MARRVGPRASRPGFTLIELLVVIAIIGMIMSLLLPAVNAARESGRGNTCRNNMRNLTLAIISYESRRNSYPSILNQQVTTGNVNRFRSLVYMVLPELERNDIYNRYGVQYNAEDTPRIHLAILLCPSDPQQAGALGAPTAFVYNQGLPQNAAAPGGSGAYGYQPASAVFGQNPGLANNSAFIGTHDGTATTLMLAESLYAGNWNIDWTGWGGQVNSWQQWISGFNWQNTTPGNWQLFNINSYKLQANPPANQVSNHYIYGTPSSNHPQSVNVAFCDGHVRTLNEGLDYRVVAALMTPSGRDVNLQGQPDRLGARTIVLQENAY